MPFKLHPYHDLTFGGFFIEFFYRMWMLLTGQLGWEQLATDEIQIFVLAGIAASSALVGCFLVLRKMTMLANSLSHTILIGIVLAFVFTLPLTHDHPHDSYLPPISILLVASLLTGFLTAFLTEFLTRIGKLPEDAATGLVFTSLFALGIILVTLLTRSAHIGTEAVMGNADALHIQDIPWTFWILGGNILLFSVLFKEFKITTFDPSLAMALGISPLFFNYLLMAQVSATAIGAFRAVGVLLVLSFMTGPPLAARLLTNDLKKMLVVSTLLGILAAFMGVAITRHILTVYGAALSTSGIVVCVIGLLYAFTILCTVIKRNRAKRELSFELNAKAQSCKDRKEGLL